MYSDDKDFQEARKRLFSTRFVDNSIVFAKLERKRTYVKPKFLDPVWTVRFYNIPFYIDENHTILVKENGEYSYYNKLTNEEKFFHTLEDEEGSIRLYRGRKHRKAYE